VKHELSSSVTLLSAPDKSRRRTVMSSTLERLADRLYEGNANAVVELTQQALVEGLPPDRILRTGLVMGMDRVGTDFRDGILFVPEVLVVARAMHAGMDVLRPLLAECDAPSAGKIVIGTVAGDLHDIGKNLVAMMLEGAGFEVVDLDIDVEPQGFVEAVQREQPDLVGMSALLTTTMTSMKTAIDALLEAGLRGQVKVIVGGAPVSEAYAEQIGADGYAADAAGAVVLARALIGE
jgi:5-methyltetrahydrofolate--homocysteine methyltransferase